MHAQHTYISFGGDVKLVSFSLFCSNRKKGNQTNKPRKSLVFSSFCLTWLSLVSVWFGCTVCTSTCCCFANVDQTNAEKGTSTSIWLVLVFRLSGPDFSWRVFAVYAVLSEWVWWLPLLLLAFAAIAATRAIAVVAAAIVCFSPKCVAMQIIFFVWLYSTFKQIHVHNYTLTFFVNKQTLCSPLSLTHSLSISYTRCVQSALPYYRIVVGSSVSVIVHVSCVSCPIHIFLRTVCVRFSFLFSFNISRFIPFDLQRNKP